MCPGQVVSWFTCCPIHQKVLDLIPGKGTYLGCGSIPSQGKLWEATYQCFSHIDVSLSLSLSPFLSLKIQQKHILR